MPRLLLLLLIGLLSLVVAACGDDDEESAGSSNEPAATATEAADACDPAALELKTDGVLTVGTLSDAPPSICINAAGQFTGFDNELLRAIAGKVGLQVNFVGTEFSGLLAQTASGRFDVGSSSITTTDARRRTAAAAG